MRRALSFVATACAWCACTQAMTFTHPGVLVSSSQLEYIKAQVKGGTGPVAEAYTKALSSPYGSLSYTPAGPPASGVIECGSYSKPNYGCSDEDADASAAYLQSLLFAITGKQQYATNAATIVDGYAQRLKKYNNSNAPLQSAWGLSKWARAAELLAHLPGTGWTGQSAFLDTLYRVSLPLIVDGSGSNGNWELSMIEGMIGLAVASENSTLFDHAVAFWRERVPAYFYITSDGDKPVPAPRGTPSWYGQSVFNGSTNGVCQETCRDEGHTSYGIAATINAAQTAALQGVDLLTEGQDRITSTMEFNAAFLLGPGDGGRSPPHYVCNGQGVVVELLPTYEIGYAHYAGAKGIALPLTARHIKDQVRAEAANPCDPHMMVYETMTHGIEIA